MDGWILASALGSGSWRSYSELLTDATAADESHWAKCVMGRHGAPEGMLGELLSGREQAWLNMNKKAKESHDTSDGYDNLYLS